MAVVGWQLSHPTLQKHPKFKSFGERIYFPSSLLTFPVKVHVLNHLKPEDVRLLFRPACHINKTDALHLQNQQQQQKNPKEAAREGGDSVAFKRRINENLCFCKYSCNLQSVRNCAPSNEEAGNAFKQLGEELRNRKKGKQ